MSFVDVGMPNFSPGRTLRERSYAAYVLASLPEALKKFDYSAHSTASGTGGSAGPRTIVALNGEILEITVAAPEESQAASGNAGTIESLNYIKDTLGISITQLADLFGVTRKAVYDWYEGSEPRSNTAARIEILREALNDTAQDSIDLKRLKGIWNVETNGTSFRSIFGDDSLDAPALRSALSEKLNELTNRLAPAQAISRKGAPQLGNAWLADLERSADA